MSCMLDSNYNVRSQNISIDWENMHLLLNTDQNLKCGIISIDRPAGCFNFILLNCTQIHYLLIVTNYSYQWAT